jgi:hypothetical protein
MERPPSKLNTAEDEELANIEKCQIFSEYNVAPPSLTKLHDKNRERSMMMGSMNTHPWR